MKIEELENIIIDLENNVTYNKDEKIDEEKAKKIIETKYSQYKNYSDSIINHFKDRRNTIKNSLLRRKWHKDKTFQNRKTDKIKTRKNTQNINESLNKIIEAQELCKSNILPLINNLFVKESLDNHLLKINEYIFLSEIDKIKNIKISENRIKDNNLLKEKIEKISKNLNDIKLPDNIIDIDEISNMNTNEIKDNKNDNLTDKFFNDIKKKPDSCETGISSNNDNKKINERKIQSNKNINKNNLLFPPLSLDFLKTNNNTNDNFINNKTNRYRVRIRLNRINNIVVDRYIQLENDSNPFHDSFNKIINNYKRFNNNEFEINALENKNFENLYNSYNLNKVRNLPLDESDEESTGLNNDIKQFSNSYKQFLKFKRIHT